MGIKKFIQLLIIRNEKYTHYYAAYEQEVDKKFVFTYLDKNNNEINNLFAFTNNFLDTCSFSKYISRYVINKTKEKSLLAMRAYQVHGVEAAINQIKKKQIEMVIFDMLLAAEKQLLASN